MEVLSESSKEFLEQLIEIRNYWLNYGRDAKGNKLKKPEDILDGFIFSLCAMIDGESGINNFNHIMLSNNYSNRRINEHDWLHEHYHQVLSEVNENGSKK